MPHYTAQSNHPASENWDPYPVSHNMTEHITELAAHSRVCSCPACLGEPDEPTDNQTTQDDYSLFDQAAELIESLLNKGYTTDQIINELRQRGVTVGQTALAVIYGTEAVWKIKKGDNQDGN
jgi:hypothetical protein